MSRWPASRRTEPAGAPPARMCWRDDLVTVLLSGWLIIGVSIDGWAHNIRTRSPAPPR
jgi:hypothetical protein